MGFIPSKSDADFWYRDKRGHYEYIAYFVDKIMVYSRNTSAIIEEIQEIYSFKGV